MESYDPRPPLRDLRWHTCTQESPWRREMGQRARHPDAIETPIGDMWCPHCRVTFPKTN